VVFSPHGGGKIAILTTTKKKEGAEFSSMGRNRGCQIFIFPPMVVVIFPPWWGENLFDFPPMVVVFPANLGCLVVPEKLWKNPPPWGENFPSMVGGK